MSKLYDYLLDKYGLGVHDESDMDIIRDIVLEETGFKWIPVSERLPEIGALKRFSEHVIVTTNEEEVVQAYYGYDTYWRSILNRRRSISNRRILNVIAWMPLPKPYKP